MPHEYALYNLHTYLIPSERFHIYKVDFSLEEACDELESIGGWHYRIDPGKKYIYYADIDGFTSDILVFRNDIFELLESKYGIELEPADFKYTANRGKSGSYHVSIPKIYGYPGEFKKIGQMVLDKYPEKYISSNGNIIDLLVYSERWFRCPNQKKEGKSGTEHRIVFGEMRDFIIEYIPDYSIEIDNIDCSISSNESDIPDNIEIETIKYIDVKTLSKNNKKKTKTSKSKHSNESTNSNIQTYIYDLIDCLDTKLSDNYADWINMAFSFKNSFGDDGFKYFDYFSNKCPSKYDAKAVMNTYSNLKIHDGVKRTVKSLYFYAIKNNRDKAMNIINSNKLFDNIELSHDSICEYIYDLNANGFLWNNKQFYSLNKQNFWEKDNILFKKYLSNEIFNILTDKTGGSRNMQLISMLKNHRGKEDIFKTSQEYFTNNDIKMDNNIWLLPFRNSIYDLKNKKWIEHHPQYYISKTLSYDWTEPTEAEVKELMEIIKKILPDEDTMRTMLQLLATSLDGFNLELFVIQTGSGRNGKGLLNDLLLYALEGFAYKGNTASLTESSKSGSNPELANIDAKRVVVFREPSKDEPIQNSIMKDLTGGGNLNTRLNFSNHTDIKLNCSIFLEANDLPPFAELPNFADVERIVVIDYISTFVSDIKMVDASNHLYMKNPFFKTDEFKEKYKYALLKILMTNYVGQNIIIPDKIKKRSEKYLENSFKILDWLEDNIDFDGKENNYISLSSEFKAIINKDSYFTKNKKKDIVREITDTIIKKYPKCIFYDRKTIDNNSYRNIIQNAKFKTDNYKFFNIKNSE